MNKLQKLKKDAVILKDGKVKLPFWVVSFAVLPEELEPWDYKVQDEDAPDKARLIFFGSKSDEEAKTQAQKCLENPPEESVGEGKVEFEYIEFNPKAVPNTPEWEKWFECLQKWV